MRYRGLPVVVSIDDAAPNVLYLDRDAPILMTVVDRNTYTLCKGRMRLGEIVFSEGEERCGWQFIPRSNRLRPSRKLHPDAMAAIRGRVRPDYLVRGNTVSVF
jgi:hypothetical protein